MTEKEIYNYLKQKGFNDYIVAGLMGNLKAESNIVSNSVEKGRTPLNNESYTKAADNGTTNFVYDAIGYGLAQWTYWSRKKALLEFAKSREVSIGDCQMQLDFLIKELKEKYKTVYNSLLKATSVKEASNILLVGYEKPADQGPVAQTKRANFGQYYYNLYANGDATINNPMSVIDYPILKRGDRGASVKTCQELLIKKGYNLPIYGADGDFGQEMFSAVFKFQQDKGLEVDGIVGPLTWATLLKEEKPTFIPQEQKPNPIQSQPTYKSQLDPQKVINVAIAEVGYLEKKSNAQLDDKTANAGYNNWNKYARDIDQNYPNFYNGRKNGYAWCDIFVDWCFIKAYGVNEALQLLKAPQKSCGAGCSNSANYFRKAGQFHKYKPQPGDQIFFGDEYNEGHTGLVYSVDNNYVYTIEGNTSGGNGVIANGGGVFKKRYPLHSYEISGYGRPNYTSTISTPSISTYGLLRMGNTGIEVKNLQTDLIKLGYSCGPDGADGDFGNATLNAVLKFQQDNNLEIDGIVGTKTSNAIKAKLKTTKIQVTANVLNVRLQPETDSQIITTIKKGQIFEMSKEQNGFGKIDSLKGWVSLSYVKKI